MKTERLFDHSGGSAEGREGEGVLSEGVLHQTPPAADMVIPEMAPGNGTAVAADSSGNTSGEADPAAEEQQAVPQLLKRELANLLDETMGDLIALEDFDGTVDARAFENEWLGAHNDISREAIREELLRKGKYTAHIDDAGKLLSDPDEYRLAVDIGVQITLCVHRGRTEDQKREFILRSQTGKRMLTYEQQRELKNSLMLVRLRLRVDYDTIGKMFGVCPNTVRNLEKRAAADPNSNFEIARRPDGRFKPETQEKIAKAAELRKAGMSDADIATIFDTDVETVGRWFKDSPARDKAKRKAKSNKVKKAVAGRRKELIEDPAASDGPSELHQRALEHLKLDASAYAVIQKDRRDDARETVKGEAIYSSVAELLNHAAYGIHLTAAADARLEELLRAGGEEDVVEEDAVEEEPVAAPGPDAGGYEGGEVLDGTVLAIEPDEVFVELPNGDLGVITKGDTVVARLAVAEDGDEARIRVNGFGLEPGLADREPMTQDDHPRVVEPNLDDRSSPYEKHFGRKEGPKN